MNGPRPGTATTFAPDLGVIRLSRAQLAHLVALPGGGTPREDRQATAPATAEAAGRRAPERELNDLGALGPDGPHAALAPTLAVLRRARSRFFLRRWNRDGRRLVEVVVGPGGIVVLPDGTDPDEPQDLRHHPRPSALARVMAGLLGLGPTTGQPVVPGGPLGWDQVKALASDPPPWGTAGLGPDDEVTVHDLVWQPRIDGPRGSVLVLVGLGAGGTVEVEAIDRSDPARGYRLVARRPEEIWVGLCRLTASVGR
ncbi:hypothetical protein BH20ACT2_BH20ACT2_08180 [soil metagenome]